MRVTAAISHPHPALPACQNAFHNSLARGQAGLPKYISKFIGKWAGPPAESVINSPTAGRPACRECNKFADCGQAGHSHGERAWQLS